MASVYLCPAFHSGKCGAQRPGAGRVRFALALTVSVFFHAWLAAGIALEVPGRSMPPAARPLTAQLQPLAAPPKREAHPEGNPVLADPVQPLPSRARVRPPAEQLSVSERKPGRVAPPAPAMAGAAPGSALPLTADTYYAAPELDVFPMPRVPLRFEYPAQAAREQVGGRVLVMLSIDETGVVDDVGIVRGEPQGYFEDAVRAALKAARFFPGRKDERAVKSRILINLDFDPGASEGALR
ncbi:MAG: TonB family protein [Betaproteobacteria bacterium]|nr:TonB family protein [Betaproteobacteria bacterium]